MLSFLEFFQNCTGHWTTERTYHMTAEQEVERSYTKFDVAAITALDKQQLLAPTGNLAIAISPNCALTNYEEIPGFTISFDTVSEKGEKVAMSLKALFVPDTCVTSAPELNFPPLPTAAAVSNLDEVVQGYYLRNEGYSEAGAIAGRFTYQPTRQTLEMITYYKRSVAVDQMRFIALNQRLRTIVTYKRSQAEPNAMPTEVTLVGFGLEQRQS